MNQKLCGNIPLFIPFVAVIIGILILFAIFFFQEKVLVVGPDDEFTTIQAAVDASDTGDIIIVTAEGSPYEEAVTISNKNKLKVIGIRKPVLDGSTIMGTDGITIINSSNIRIQGLVIQSFIFDPMAGGGIGIVLENSPCNIIKRNQIANNDLGIVSNDQLSVNNTFIRNKVINSLLTGTQMASENNKFIKNEYVDNGDVGLLATGNSNIFIGNKSINNTFDGISSSGDNSILIGNCVRGNGSDDAMDLDGNNNILIGNKVTNNPGGCGINLSGDIGNNIVIANTSSNNAETGIINDDNSTNNIMIGNKLIGNGEDGIIMDNDSSNHLVLGNCIIGNARDGIRVGDNANNHTILSNKIKENGSGIFLRQPFNMTIAKNKIAQNIGRGIDLINSDNNTIKRNKILTNGDVGVFLDIDSEDNRVLFNRVLGNTPFDIQDEGTDNVFIGNRCGTSSPANICID